MHISPNNYIIQMLFQPNIGNINNGSTICLDSEGNKYIIKGFPSKLIKIGTSIEEILKYYTIKEESTLAATYRLIPREE